MKLVLGVPRSDAARERRLRPGLPRAPWRPGWTDTAVDVHAGTPGPVRSGTPFDLTITYQGGPGSWSHRSLLEQLPGGRAVGCETVADAWHMVRSGYAVAAWLATRNSTVGPVPQAAEVARSAESWLVVEVPIRHAVSAIANGEVHAVRRIEGHPLALAQCERSLRSRWPDAHFVPTVDGAHSANLGTLAAGTAVVGPIALGQRPGWRVLAADVSDRVDNVTTFELVLPTENP